MNTAKIIRQEFDSKIFTTLKTVNIPQEVVDGITVEKSVYIYRPVSEVYHFWRRLENLPEIVNNLKYIEVKNMRHSHWVMKVPFAATVEWNAEIIEEHENEMLSWASLKGSEVAHAGTIHFEPMLDGRGTEVSVQFTYRPPFGKFGLWVASLFGYSPEKQVEEALYKLKDALEESGWADTKELPVFAN